MVSYRIVNRPNRSPLRVAVLVRPVARRQRAGLAMLAAGYHPLVIGRLLKIRPCSLCHSPAVLPPFPPGLWQADQLSLFQEAA